MDSSELKRRRTKDFALRVIRLCASLPRRAKAEVIGRQLLRAGTSVGANYRAACKARSPTEFAAKMGIVEEEADECGYWIELLVNAAVVSESKVRLLHKEAAELTAIAAASRKTARLHSNNRQLAIGNRQLGRSKRA